MSLSESRALNGVHPWLAVRARFLGDIIEHFRGVQIYLSGFRTLEQQELLYRRRGGKPVARPGCSQHQYGYAVDLAWGAVFEESPLGPLNTTELAELMSGWGRQLGLITVRGDPGHFQVFPGNEFRTWAVSSGFCVPPPTINPIRQSYLDCLTDARSRTAFNTPMRDALVSNCFKAFANRNLAEQSRVQGFKVTGSAF